MPFGAEVLDGAVSFRLWAPAAERVDLCLQGEGEETFLPLEPQPDGWFCLETDRAQPGVLYQYRINGERRVSDPVSRFQPQGVHGPSQVIDPHSWDWQDEGWQGRPWQEAVIYELHVGCFTTEGTFAAVIDKLDYLVELGVTALELMPVASFPGTRNWGYDGVLPFAPDPSYGTPEDLKKLVQEAHRRGIMVLLDVVYNHFGPEGNYLHLYAPDFFTNRYQTPWGAAINFDGPGSHWVRQFFIHNALYWLEEYNFDGLRLDAVHAIFDQSEPDILVELAETVRHRSDAPRPAHLILENDNNEAWYLRLADVKDSLLYNAQWNDDLHHALHVLVTGETSGYYADYQEQPIRHLGRCLSEGFAYQGEDSPFRNKRPRGEVSRDLPPASFVNFLQNHDQVGNRAKGERITALASRQAVGVASVVLLLSPSPPLLFMGEEWGAAQPFPFFCDFGPDLAPLVTRGRREEFAHFPEFNEPASREQIPDPNRKETFQAAVLDWQALVKPPHAEWLNLHRRLLKMRRQKIMPLISGVKCIARSYKVLADRVLEARWRFQNGAALTLLANFGDEDSSITETPAGNLLVVFPDGAGESMQQGTLPAWSALWYANPGE